MFRHICVILFCLGAPLLIEAQVPYPTRGIVYNTTERSALTFDCSNRGQQLHCKFVQTRVRQQLNDAEVDARRGEQLRDYDNATAELRRQGCSEIEKLVDMLDGREPPPDPIAFATMSQQQKLAARESIATLLQFCREPTRDNYARVIDDGIKRDNRTCVVSGLEFEQTFAHPGSEDVWVVDEGGPQGECGVINLSRFERDNADELGGLLWKYYARKAITNPRADAGLFSCSELDQEEYEYDWRSKDHFVQCDVVQFGVF